MKGKHRLLFREAIQYAQLYAAGRTPYVPKPIEAALYLTQKCNSRCSMCDFWRNNHESEELSTQAVLSLLDELSELGVIILSLSAEGELTLRKDLPEILEKIHKKGFLYSINSNFLNLTDEVIFLLKQYPPYQITVGLDTLNDENYAAVRGIKMGASKVMSNIEKAQQAGFTNLVCGTVVLYETVHDLLELTSYVKKNTLKGIRFTAFQPFGFGKRWSEEELEKYTNPDFQARLSSTITSLIQMKKNGAPILNSIPYLQLIPQSYGMANFFPLSCIVPWRRIHIFSDGRVSLCQVLGTHSVIGTYGDASLRSLWFSTKAANIRGGVKNKGCGGCWLSCYQETNIRFSSCYGKAVALHALNRFKQL